MATRKKYSQYPKTVLGLRCSQHRAHKMRPVSEYYKKPGWKYINKDRLLEYLVDLEKELPDKEIEVISSWLSGDRSNENRGLDDQLDVARGKYEGIECCVCTGSFPVKRFFQVTSDCDHLPRACKDCITQSINYQIGDVAWDKVKCPECSETLKHGDVQQWASKEAFEKYDEKAAMSAMPDITMCLGPKCGSGQVHDGGDAQPIMTCNACGFKTCYTHKMPWHPDQTCTEYDAERNVRMEQEAASEKFIVEKLAAKTCPNRKCGARIEKNGGCDHMSCDRCRKAFCYSCLAPWERIVNEGNTAHSPDCKHHTNNLPNPNFIEPIEFEDDETDFETFYAVYNDSRRPESPDVDNVGHAPNRLEVGDHNPIYDGPEFQQYGQWSGYI